MLTWLRDFQRALEDEREVYIGYYFRSRYLKFYLAYWLTY